MKKNAKMKVLYQDGNMNMCKPFTFEVELVRWKRGVNWIHYVLLSTYTTDELDDLPDAFMVLKWRKMVSRYQVIDVETNGEAIREAVAEYDRLKAFVDGFKAGDALVEELKPTLDAYNAQIQLDEDEQDDDNIFCVSRKTSIEGSYEKLFMRADSFSVFTGYAEFYNCDGSRVGHISNPDMVSRWTREQLEDYKKFLCKTKVCDG